MKITIFHGEVLAASFKNSQQVLELTKYGIGASTVATDVIEGLIKNAAIDAAIDALTKILSQLQEKEKQWQIANSQSLSNRRVSGSGARHF